MTSLRIAVVDDEPPARRRIRRLCGQCPGVDVVGEAGSGHAAVDLVERLQPDVLLLDIQMPDFDGFEVVRRLRPPRPAIIFVTAYDEFALRAFELHALDYLLKPFTSERFVDAIGHAGRLVLSNQRATLDPLLDVLARERPYLSRVSIKQGSRIHVVALSNVSRIEAADNYVTLHTPDGEYLWRETLNRVEARVDPGRFVRVHRSTIVRLDLVDRFDERSRGDYDVVLRDGSRVALGRSYRSRVLRALG
jgi:two-component system LytT family response regulator